MTNRERYEAGLVMERNGATGEDIAAALGYTNKNAWWNDKHLHKKKDAKAEEVKQSAADEHEQLQQGLAARARENKSPAPEPTPILEGIPERVPVPRKTNQVEMVKAAIFGMSPFTENITEALSKGITIAAQPTFAKRLTIKKELSAKGQQFTYRIMSGNVHIRRNIRNALTLVLSMDELHTMLAELGELLLEEGEQGRDR